MNRPKSRLKLDSPLIKPAGRRLGLTNDQISALLSEKPRRSGREKTQADEKELMRRRQLHALAQLKAWNEKEHPELKHGAARHISKMRRQDEKRFRKLSFR